jgi:erythronate-4-phosphate dehydrogenase
LRIVADQNIAYVEQAFATLGEVTALPAAQIDAQVVRDADLLLCRSTLKVGPALLEGSRVRWVATATIGTDHLDLPYLAARGIGWAAAPGSNADSVVQWFAAALLRLGIDVKRTRIGVVGVGNVGRRIARLAALLAQAAQAPPPLLCDPPRARAEGSAAYVALEQLLAESDLVTLHVPLERTGAEATLRLLDAPHLALMRPGAGLINASRGEVIDESALLAARPRLGVLALDVFPGEPCPSPALVDVCSLATPHIAGHSLEGKINGTRMIYSAACRLLGTAETWVPAPPPAEPAELVLDATRPEAELLLRALAAHYDIDRDHAALAQLVTLPAGERGAAFSRYRANYPLRRELSALTLICFSPNRDWARRLGTIC